MIATCLGSDQHLEVTTELLLHKAWQYMLQHGTTEYFDARLRVLDIQPEEQSHEIVIPHAQESADRRIGHSTHGMAFRADDDISFVPDHMLHEHADATRIDLHPRVEEHDIVPCRMLHAMADRVTFAMIFRIAEHVDEEKIFFQEPVVRLVVVVAIDDADDFVGEACSLQSIDDEFYILNDRVFLTVNGHYQG